MISYFYYRTWYNKSGVHNADLLYDTIRADWTLLNPKQAWHDMVDIIFGNLLYSDMKWLIRDTINFNIFNTKHSCIVNYNPSTCRKCKMSCLMSKYMMANYWSLYELKKTDKSIDAIFIIWLFLYSKCT